MGSLRLFLAISILVDHTTPLGSLQLMPDVTPVWLFFIISGFYMQMIASGKYGDHIWTFYSNRALRLYPVYFIAAALALAHTGALRSLAAPPPALYLPTFIANTTLFGGDLLFYFGEHGRLLVGPAWSIGLELWFYLLVPVLSRANSVVVLTCSAVSAGLAMHMEAAQPGSSYYFFPANFYLFGAGMLAFRAMNFLLALPFKWDQLVHAAAIAGVALLVLRPLIPGFRNYPWAQEIVLVVCLPFIFEATRSLRWDRAIGNLSYSVYLLHEPVMNWLGGRPSGIVTLLITLPLALAVYIVVESPIDRWRQRRAVGRPLVTQQLPAA
jgi:peptidoglycan/LPS O-acetylase OafA/YrhL